MCYYTYIMKIRSKLTNFKTNERGDMGAMMSGAILAIVALVVVAVLASAIIPSAITAIVATNTSTWGAGAIAMWSVLAIFVVLAVLLIFVGIALYIMKEAK
jgi:type II secretory pathway component PulF